MSRASRFAGPVRGAGLALAAALVGAAGCGDGADPAPGPVEFRGPAGSGEPFLAAASGDRFLLTWHEEVGSGGYALRLAERRPAVPGEAGDGSGRGGGWSAPRTIAERETFFVNWADFPSITEMADGTLLVHWLEKVAAEPYAYHVLASLSRDGGGSWGPPVRVHEDDRPVEHGFVSAAAWRDGVAMVWLDGREMGPAVPPPESEAGGASDGGGAMTLRARTVGPAGTLGEEALLDTRTCECCATAMARTRRGLVVAYRDRGPDEVRDVWAVRHDGAGWGEPRPVHEDGWRITGCPVNGPQLAATGDRVAVAWFTAAGSRPRVLVAFSEDAGERWGPPVRVDLGLPLGRVDVEMLPDGSAAVSWVEAAGDEAGAGDDPAGVLVRRVDARGAAGPPLRVSETSASRASGFPRMAVGGGELLLAWTRPGPEGGIRVRAVRLARLAAAR